MVQLCARLVVGFASAAIAVSLAMPGSAAPDEKDKRPSIALKATPAVSFTPARIRVVAELKGGPDDYQEYYCAGVEWDWDDGTVSESTVDCEPYEAGKSRITRRFFTEHQYRQPGQYRISFRLKKDRKVVASSTASVNVRAGVGVPGG